jgi:GMP synthase (glutamine-hydrolysing)
MPRRQASETMGMPKLLVFQHVAWEILGTLDPLLRSYCFRNRYVNFGRQHPARVEIDGYHGLIVLGGPMNADQVDAHPHLDTEVRVIRDAIERDIPVLGICLGAQLIAKALGAKVYPNPVKEIGWYDVSVTDEGRSDPLFEHFDESEKIFQWHGDTFDLPDQAVHLASSPSCRNQAFRFGERVYGLQFHLEVDAPLVHRWLGVPDHRLEIESLGGDICPDRIRAETARHVDRSMQLSSRLFSSFIGLFADKSTLRRRSPHPHR